MSVILSFCTSETAAEWISRVEPLVVQRTEKRNLRNNDVNPPKLPGKSPSFFILSAGTRPCLFLPTAQWQLCVSLVCIDPPQSLLTHDCWDCWIWKCRKVSRLMTDWTLQVSLGHKNWFKHKTIHTNQKWTVIIGSWSTHAFSNQPPPVCTHLHKASGNEWFN